jgi:hypothetical protein
MTTTLSVLDDEWFEDDIVGVLCILESEFRYRQL